MKRGKNTVVFRMLENSIFQRSTRVGYLQFRFNVSTCSSAIDKNIYGYKPEIALHKEKCYR